MSDGTLIAMAIGFHIVMAAGVGLLFQSTGRWVYLILLVAGIIYSVWWIATRDGE